MRLFRHAMLLASFSLVLPLAAQEYRATVLGSVLDPSGIGMAGAKVTVTNSDTAVSTAASSDAAGNYQIPLLNPGWYILRVEQTGFKNAQIGPFELRVNDRTTVDVRMEMGQVTETVTVQAEPPLVEAASADRGQVISAKVMTDMPVPFGNPYALMGLAAGVVFHGSEQDMRPHDNGGNDNFVINGGSRGMNDFVMDGVSSTTIQANGRPQLGYVPPAEALQEFKIQTSAYDAQNGRSGGSSISISVKAGPNEFHGSVYEYMRRQWLPANHFINNMTGTAKPNRLLDQYGGTVGGPVILPKLYNGRNKTFSCLLPIGRATGSPVRVSAVCRPCCNAPGTSRKP